MSPEPGTAQSKVTANLANETNARFGGRTLLIVKVLWVATLLALMSLFYLGSNGFYNQTRGEVCQPDSAALAKIGVTADICTVLIMIPDTVTVIMFLAIAALIFFRKPADPMAMLTSLILMLFGLTTPDPIILLTEQPGWHFVASLPYKLSVGALLILLYRFPDGRWIPRWTRPLALVWAAWVGSWLFVPALNPFSTSFTSGELLVSGCFATALVAQIVRYRHVSLPLQRQQTKCIVAGGAFALMLYGFARFLRVYDINLLGLPASLNVGFILLLRDSAICLIPISMGIAILRFRLWEIDFIINRTLVWGVLSVCVVAIYILVVGALAALFQTSGILAISLVGTGLIAILIQPLHHRLQRGVNHLLYGERDDPYTVLARLGQRLEVAIAPGAMLLTIVSTVKEALKLPYVAIALYQDEGLTVAETAGTPVPDAIAVPFSYQSRPVGQLLLGPRAPNETFSQADRRLLDNLAHQAGVAIHAARLTADLQGMTIDLQRSRERLVIAREEERRRLRRDLHDDLAPTLAALALRASTIADLIPTDPTGASALAAELYTAIRAAVGDIRRLVYDLRPPTLDELGLVAAIRERAAQYSNGRPLGSLSESPRLQVTLIAPDRLPPLPAAVEVAAYRIIQEGLTNVVRHAQASSCIIRLALADGLTIEIVDDGIGLPIEHPIGVGLHSMRERAAELGGTCVIEHRATVGTRVYAQLPVLKEAVDGNTPRPDR
ncbi:MAG: sensor histidine kinase [Aggregatilineales bacterium]